MPIKALKYEYVWYLISYVLVLQSINEESLKHLSVYLENSQNHRQSTTSTPKTLTFYVRDKNSKVRQEKFKLIRIHIDRSPDTKQIIKNILETCSLSTDYLDKIKSTSTPSSSSRKPSPGPDTFYGGEQSPFSDEYEIYAKIKKAKQEKTLR